MGRWEEVVVAALNHAYDEAKALGGKGGRGAVSYTHLRAHET